MTGGGSGHSSDAEGLAWLRFQPRNDERERRPTRARGWNRVHPGRRLQAGQTAGFIPKNGKPITVKHDVTAGVTNAVTEFVTATPAVAVDQRGNSRCYRGCYPHCYTCCGTKVAENAGDICHAVRLRLNQSLP
jgi:hypothetical protein